MREQRGGPRGESREKRCGSLDCLRRREADKPTQRAADCQARWRWLSYRHVAPGDDNKVGQSISNVTHVLHISGRDL
jgi:hypothetical protein